MMAASLEGFKIVLDKLVVVIWLSVATSHYVCMASSIKGVSEALRVIKSLSTYGDHNKCLMFILGTCNVQGVVYNATPQ